jgi:hypothetical protein
MVGLENACDLMGNFVSMSLIITTIGDFLTLWIACWQEPFQLQFDRNYTCSCPK